MRRCGQVEITLNEACADALCCADLYHHLDEGKIAHRFLGQMPPMRLIDGGIAAARLCVQDLRQTGETTIGIVLCC